MEKKIREKDAQIRIPLELHRQLRQIAWDEGKHLERVSAEIIRLGLSKKSIENDVSQDSGQNGNGQVAERTV